jgi:hypothetical protein
VGSSRITVARDSPQDVRTRQLVVSLDRGSWATLMFGERATREVEPGRHVLRVHNTLVWKTIELTLTPGEHAEFTIVNRPGWGTYTLLGMLGVGPLYVSVTRRVPGPSVPGSQVPRPGP